METMIELICILLNVKWLQRMPGSGVPGPDILFEQQPSSAGK